MPPGLRVGRRGLTLFSAAAVAAAGLVGVAAWVGSGCPGEPTDQALIADTPTVRSAPPLWSADADELDAGLAGEVGAVGLPAQPRWGLWDHVPELRGGERVDRDAGVAAVAATDGLVVTLQEFSGGGFGGGPDAVLAAYDAATGAGRWQVEWPALRGTAGLTTVAGGRLLVSADGAASLAAVDAGTGAVLWCADDGRSATTSVVATGADQVVVAAQDGSDSYLRALDATTGAQRWRTDYEDHNHLLHPVRAGEVVIVFAVPDDGGDSLLHAYGAADGRLRWTAATEPPTALGGGPAIALVAEHDYQADRDVITAVDPATGARGWTAISGRVDGIDVLDAGVLVRTDANPTGLLLLDASTGAVRWSVPAADGTFPIPPLRLAGPERLLLSGPGPLSLVDAATGAVRSAPSADGQVRAADAGGGVLVGRNGDRFTVLTAG